MAFEYIEDIGLKPARPYSMRDKTERILLHHSGSNGSVKSYHDYHISRGHAGIDYNIVVQRDGKAVWGRGLKAKGGSVNNSNAKTRGFNDTSVAVCVQGDLERDTLTAAQKETLYRVVKDLADFYELYNEKKILGHDEAAGPGYTDCPGRNFPLDDLRKYALYSHEIIYDFDKAPLAPETKPETIPELTRNLKLTSPYMRGEDVKQVQKRLDKHLVDVGGIDGIFGKKTRDGVLKFQLARIASGRFDIGAADGIVGQKTWKILWE